jgi:hypothetical protein
MNPRRFSLYGGIVMLLLGLAALIPALSQTSFVLPFLRINSSYGLFLGYFPMNIVNKLALLVFGIWGIAASSAPGTSLPASITFSRVVFVVMGLLCVLGFFRQTNTLYGYMPLFGNLIWVNGILAVMGAYFGYTLTSKADVGRKESFSNEAREPQTHGI